MSIPNAGCTSRPSQRSLSRLALHLVSSRLDPVSHPPFLTLALISSSAFLLPWPSLTCCLVTISIAIAIISRLVNLHRLFRTGVISRDKHSPLKRKMPGVREQMANDVCSSSFFPCSQCCLVSSFLLTSRSAPYRSSLSAARHSRHRSHPHRTLLRTPRHPTSRIIDHHLLKSDCDKDIQTKARKADKQRRLEEEYEGKLKELLEEVKNAKADGVEE
jgi:hypothetical protein